MIHFHKMQGAGNDFVVFDNRTLQMSLDRIVEITPALCDRKYGIGADGILVMEKSEVANYTMIYRNADGSDAGMCGNGGRCMALFAASYYFPPVHTFNVHDNIYHAQVREKEVSLTFPVTVTPHKLGKIAEFDWIQADAATEHVVTQIGNGLISQEKKLIHAGRIIRSSKKEFPKGTNVNFMYKKDTYHIGLQTYERGVENLTLACGTGAIASAITHHYLQGLQNEKNEIIVDCKGGQLTIAFNYSLNDKTYNNIQLTGPANFVFEGNYPI